MKKIAVVLSGCGAFDGAEIHETTLSLYAIERQGASYETFAPDVNQHHVINHITGEEMDETRNVLIESARISRGNIKPTSQFSANDFDALLIPGGFGAAKNLSDWGVKGSDATVIPEISTMIKAMVDAKKPIGATCISPVLLAILYQDAKMTIGEDAGTIEALESLGIKHEKTTHGEVVVDEKHKLFTTPCYMLDANIQQIGDGAENIVKAMLEIM